MPRNPLVSIITPSYNQAIFLEQTILSVLKQEYEPIEYLIVDGGSTDGSLDIIKRYKDHLTWWVSEPDAGQAEAINKGLKRAEGEIVAWLNSDDLYMPSAVSRAVAVLQQNQKLGMVFGDALSIDSTGKPINKITFGDWGLRELVRFRIICQPTVFMRRTVLEKAGYLDTTYHFMLDHHLWIRIARLAPIMNISIRNVEAQDTVLPRLDKHRQNFSPVAAARYHPTAKNVSQASDFGRETMHILDWMQKQPDISSLLDQDQNRVHGGAFRLNGRYLLEGGMPWPALKSYAQALLNWPTYTLKHWHRIIFAILCLLKIEGLTIPFRRYSSVRRSKQLTAELLRYRPIAMCQKDSSNTNVSSLESWPGLNLEI
jgi:glycosyltransferase involved in cell wall biosynthesis